MIRFNGVVKDVYRVELVSAGGKVLYTKQVVHPGGTANQAITLPRNIVPGVYSVVVTGSNCSFTRQIIK